MKDERSGARRRERRKQRSRGKRNILKHSDGSYGLRLANPRADGSGGRRHPHVAVIGIVIRRIGIFEVNGEPVVRRPGMPQVVVDEVPEYAERLHHNKCRDDEQRDDVDSIGWWTDRHRGESITRMTWSSAAIVGSFGRVPRGNAFRG
jgi:hypothetical protein